MNELRDALRPMNTDLQRDLWPEMHRRLQQPRIMFSRFDLALAAAAAALVIIFPESLITLLYHL